MIPSCMGESLVYRKKDRIGLQALVGILSAYRQLRDFHNRVNFEHIFQSLGVENLSQENKVLGKDEFYTKKLAIHSQNRKSHQQLSNNN